MKPSVAIVGCGKVGTALGKFLQAAGYPIVGFASRSRASIDRMAAVVGSAALRKDPWRAASPADIVFITTPDDAIAHTCRRILRHEGFKRGARVFHCSGSLPSTILSGAKTAGAVVGSLHPLQSFAALVHEQNPFADIPIAVEGDEAAVKDAEKIIRDLGATMIRIETEGKTLYHAAAVAASNYLVTLYDFSLQLIGRAGISAEDAPAVLRPLIEGTLANVRRVGTRQALTGPIARGDSNTVAGHLEAIRLALPRFLDLYEVLGRHTLDIARSRGHLTPQSIRALKKMLDRGR